MLKTCKPLNENQLGLSIEIVYNNSLRGCKCRRSKFLQLKLPILTKMSAVTKIKDKCSIFALKIAHLKILSKMNVVTKIEENYHCGLQAIDNSTRHTSMKPYISLTPLRTHPSYSLYNSWSRFIVLGLIPFCLLAFFNIKIYRYVHSNLDLQHELLLT